MGRIQAAPQLALRPAGAPPPGRQPATCIARHRGSTRPDRRRRPPPRRQRPWPGKSSRWSWPRTPEAGNGRRRRRRPRTGTSPPAGGRVPASGMSRRVNLSLRNADIADLRPQTPGHEVQHRFRPRYYRTHRLRVPGVFRPQLDHAPQHLRTRIGQLPNPKVPLAAGIRKAGRHRRQAALPALRLTGRRAPEKRPPCRHRR